MAFIAGVLLSLIGFSAYLFYGSLPTGSALKAAASAFFSWLSDQGSFREWFGTFAGWAAAIGAIATLRWLRVQSQLPVKNELLKEGVDRVLLMQKSNQHMRENIKEVESAIDNVNNDSCTDQAIIDIFQQSKDTFSAFLDAATGVAAIHTNKLRATIDPDNTIRPFEEARRSMDKKELSIFALEHLKNRYEYCITSNNEGIEIISKDIDAITEWKSKLASKS